MAMIAESSSFQPAPAGFSGLALPALFVPDRVGRTPPRLRCVGCVLTDGRVEVSSRVVDFFAWPHAWVTTEAICGRPTVPISCPHRTEKNVLALGLSKNRTTSENLSIAGEAT